MCVLLRACFAKEVLRAEVRETRKGERRVFAHQQGCGDTAFRVIFVAPFLVDERGGVERSANVMDAPQAQGGRRTDIRRHRHTHSQAHARTRVQPWGVWTTSASCSLSHSLWLLVLFSFGCACVQVYVGCCRTRFLDSTYTYTHTCT